MTVATYEPHGLAIAPEQVAFTDEQTAALAHIGVDKASDGDLKVFFHVCQRTGLDPFARQIHMIGRQSSENVNGEWVKVTKQTIQTGIDGFRLIGRRAADRARHKVSVSAPEWCHEDGTWRPAWRKVWGFPVAARVTITRDGEPFTAVAMFDEYVQTKRSGEPNSMWQQRPAGQLAKCCEALAWRMAFPQDLAGIYADDEMHQADSAPRPAVEVVQEDRLASLVAESVPVERAVDVYGVTEADPDGITSGQLKALGAAMREAGITERPAALAYVGDVIGREVSSRNDLTRSEAGRVLDALRQDMEAAS